MADCHAGSGDSLKEYEISNVIKYNSTESRGS